MDILILFTIFLVGGIFALFASGGRITELIIWGIIGVIVMGLIVYFCMPALTLVGILIMMAIFAIVGSLIGAVIDSNAGLPYVGLITGGGILVILVIGFVLAPALSADTLYSLPHVTSHTASNVSLVSSDHIREVSKDTASWRADKVIGDFGYKDEVSTMNIQAINGSLVWLAPLDYNGFWKAWSYGEQGTDGYVIIQAENSKAPVTLIQNIPMKFTNNAIFGHNLERNMYMEYPGYYMGEHTFQLDDKGNPKWVTMVSDPAVLDMIGDIPRGIIVTDPINGENTFYYTSKAPAWVERVMDEGVTERYLQYWGEYSHGWMNTMFGQKDYLVPTGGLSTATGSESGSVAVEQSTSPDVYMVRGTDNNLYWFGSFTTVGKDTSMVGYMLTNLKTGEFNFYPSGSIYNDIGAAKNVQQNPEVAKVMGAKVTQPIMYMINGEEVWVMPVITQSGENIMMGVVRARTGETFVAPDLKTALKELNGGMNLVTSLPTSAGTGTSLDLIINNLTSDLNQLKQYKAEHPNA